MVLLRETATFWQMPFRVSDPRIQTIKSAVGALVAVAIRNETGWQVTKE
jgi:hypothetical protein